MHVQPVTNEIVQNETGGMDGAQFPNLYCLVRDLFSIPGMFLAFLFSRIY